MAGRPENPVDRTVPARAVLADFLRSRRKSAGLTYAEMERITGISAATFKRAASGKQVPTMRTVRIFVDLTESPLPTERDTTIRLEKDQEHAVYLWLRARRADRGPHVYKAPDPLLIADMADFSHALRDLHAWAGSPSTHWMEKVAANHNVLPHTTAHRIIKGLTVPNNEPQLMGYLIACEVDLRELDHWREAWERAKKTYAPRRTRIAEWTKRARVEAEQDFNLITFDAA